MVKRKSIARGPQVDFNCVKPHWLPQWNSAVRYFMFSFFLLWCNKLFWLSLLQIMSNMKRETCTGLIGKLIERLNRSVRILTTLLAFYFRMQFKIDFTFNFRKGLSLFNENSCPEEGRSHLRLVETCHLGVKKGHKNLIESLKIRPKNLSVYFKCKPREELKLVTNKWIHQNSTPRIWALNIDFKSQLFKNIQPENLSLDKKLTPKISVPIKNGPPKKGHVLDSPYNGS